MDTSPVRLRPRRFRRSRQSDSVEELLSRLERLTADRQRLRSGGAGSVELERNRVEIARAQWELSHALIERHCVRVARARSAA